MQMAAWGHALPIAIGLGRTEEIEFLAEQLEPFGNRHMANGAGAGVYMGPVALHIGLAAAALGHLDAAVADLQTAASICDGNGARGYAVQARVELAAALARRQAPGDLGQAAAALDAAAGEAEQLGMVPFTRRIGQLRARLPAAGAAHSQLSPREQEVARLVGQGLTNRQIATALYISERTAQNHVQHILTKLGFANRSQIAVWSGAHPAPAE
jgi:DNA-binding CsgD family transcriptional regulator